MTHLATGFLFVGDLSPQIWSLTFTRITVIKYLSNKSVSVSVYQCSKVVCKRLLISRSEGSIFANRLGYMKMKITLLPAELVRFYYIFLPAYSFPRGDFLLFTQLDQCNSSICTSEVQLLKLASSGPYGPLLARSGYPGHDATFYNNPMIMISATENALSLK